MSIGAELGQYILQTHNFCRPIQSNYILNSLFIAIAHAVVILLLFV